MSASEGQYAVRIPADVDRPDLVLGRLTARQVAILAGTGLTLWAGYSALRAGLSHLSPVIVLAGLSPLALVALALAMGRRDGVNADRLVYLAIRHFRSPARRVAVGKDAGVEPVPGFLPPEFARAAGPLPAPLEPVAEGIDPGGVLDLGRDGAAKVAACGTVNFALRTSGEQDALTGVFARYLNSLTGPVQILVRTHRLDLSTAIADLEQAAPGLPHPALEAAALDHAAFLRELSGRRDLLARQVLLTVREPQGAAGRAGRNAAGAGGAAAGARISRRVEEAARILPAAGVAVRAFDAAGLAWLLADSGGAEAAHFDENDRDHDYDDERGHL